MNHNKIAFPLFSLCILIFSINCHCQNTFEFTIGDTLTDQLINDAVELYDGSFILLGQEVYPTDQEKAHLIHISESGSLLRTKTLTFQGQSSGFIKIIQMDPNLFLMEGYTVKNDTSKLWLYEMDSLFNEVRSKIMDMGPYNSSYLSQLSISNGNILCSGNLLDPVGQVHYAFIYKISSTFDSLQLRVFTEHNTQLAFDLLVKNNNQGYYSIMSHFGPPTNDVIVDLDTSFSIKNIYGVPKDVTDFPEAKWINNSTFILTGRKVYFQGPPNEGIEVLCLDTVGNLKYNLFIGDHDTIEWPGLRSRLDFIDTNKIYVGGTHNFCQASEFCPVHCWFSLNQLDTALNVHWQHFYGGDANYTMYGIRATRDKGCLMFGSRYDLQSSTLQRDIYVIRVNQNGLVDGISDKTNPKIHDAIVYPNPGSGFLVVESGPQISGAQFRITSIDGIQVIAKTLAERKTIIDTQFLSPGIYVWQIFFQNRVIETGKWIRE